MNKQALMTTAHKIAKSIVASVGDYQVAMKIALKQAWSEAQMKTLTVTSTNGTAFTLTDTGSGIAGEAKGIKMSSMLLNGATIAAQFPVRIGGKPVKISAELDSANAKRAAEFFAKSEKQVAEKAAHQAAYDARTARIYATA